MLKVNRSQSFLGALAFLLVTVGGASVEAAEGMFQLFALPTKDLERSGLKVPVKKIVELRKAVAQVGRGGSASFVSPHGLLVTNHHVAYSCLTRLGATKAHQGLLGRGYVAKDRAAELACPGLDLHVVARVQDVTKKVLEGLPEGTRRNYHRRYVKLKAQRAALRKACEAKGAGLSCKVTANNHGTSYTLTAYRRIRDVRLVYAPPKALGKYGGDVDNWMFPRHTADFTYLRAYVDAEGRGAPHAAGNVPLKTPVYLEQGRWGVKRGSLMLVMGFPGRTARHVTSHGVRFHRTKRLRGTISLLQGAAKALAARTRVSADAKRKYASLDARLQNGLKYYTMSSRGFARWKVLVRKAKAEQALLAALPGKERKAGEKLLAEIGAVYERFAKVQPRHSALVRMAYLVPSIGAISSIASWSVERSKPEAKRSSSRFLDKNVYRLLSTLDRLDGEVQLATEQALLRYFIEYVQALPRKQRSKAVARLLRWGKREEAKLRRRAKLQANKAGKGASAEEAFGALFAARCGQKPHPDLLGRTTQLLFGGSSLVGKPGSKALRRELWKASRKAIVAHKDPLLRFARELDDERRKLREGPLRLIEEYLGPVLARRWVKRFLRPRYDDANFTVRLSYGSVRDYKEAATGKTHNYMTDVAGLVAKDKGKYPFAAPAWLKKAAEARGSAVAQRYHDAAIKGIPVNFTSTLDTTGGNSGSAVLDDHGRLVGLLFDGTPESIVSDWQYNHAEQRSICLDIRFAHYLAELQGATALLRELGLRK